MVVDVRPGHDPQEVEALVEAELRSVVDSTVSEAELARVKTNFESAFVWNLETLLRRAEQLQFFNHYAGDPGYLPEYLETYRSRTAADIQKVAREVLGRPRVQVVTIPAPADEAEATAGRKGAAK